MEKLALKLLSYTEGIESIEFTELEIEYIHNIGELLGKLEIMYIIKDVQGYSLDKGIKEVQKDLFHVIKGSGMLDPNFLEKILNKIPICFEEDYMIKLLSEYRE